MAAQKEFYNKKPDTQSRLIGTVIPVGALKTEKSLGVGEFPDLAEFGELCVKMGIGLIQLLPVNDTGYQSSPYSALTAFGLHPLYLRIGNLPESAAFGTDIEAIREKNVNAARFSHGALLRDKMDLLKKIFDDNKKGICSSPALKAWIEENPWVKPYAVFRQLKEANSEKSWREWDGQNGQSGQTAEAININALWDDPSLAGEHLFWAWIQQALDAQFSAAVASLADLGIVLLGDLPILMNEDSCDVWAHPENFNLDMSAGAPPDMYSPEGQNWGFPIYNWEEQSKDGYSWWKARLKAAEKYYHAYRIDHVLGFFRIWASRREDNSALLGRYTPFLPAGQKDFKKLDFDESRVRWVTEPHILTGEVWDSLKGDIFDENELREAANRVFDLALDRIGDEHLWLFRKNIRGEKDICALDIHPAAKAFLLKAWGNRIFFEHESGKYYPVWYYNQSRAYASLSEEEREALEAILQRHLEDSEKTWEEEGKKLLSVLTSSCSMLPCAEDLGAVPACVPKVLTELNILGLRVVRWYREWGKEGEPYVPFEEYPELSV